MSVLRFKRSCRTRKLSSPESLKVATCQFAVGLAILTPVNDKPAWRNWQTRLIQNQVPFGSGGSSPLAGILKAQETLFLEPFLLIAFASVSLVCSFSVVGDFTCYNACVTQREKLNETNTGTNYLFSDGSTCRAAC